MHFENEYSVEFDTVSSEDWDKIIQNFADGNLYQTWSHDAARFGKDKSSHFILKQSSEIIAAAQIRIIRFPIIGLGAAYVFWGPMWQLRNGSADPHILKIALRELRKEYVVNRRLSLRIFPALYDNNSDQIFEFLKEEGYTLNSQKGRSRTLLLDLNPPIEDIRKNFNQKWRNGLNKAERNNLEVIEGTEDTLFDEFIKLYKSLLQRKRFREPNDIRQFKLIQCSLPAKLKMRVFICRSGQIASAGAIFSNIGETGLYLFGATNEQGLSNKGSYLLQWRGIQWLKKTGCKRYNLNGINPKKNPGGYHFKAGIAGKKGIDVHYLGIFECYINGLTAALGKTADALNPYIRRIIAKN